MNELTVPKKVSLAGNRYIFMPCCIALIDCSINTPTHTIEGVLIANANSKATSRARASVHSAKQAIVQGYYDELVAHRFAKGFYSR